MGEATVKVSWTTLIGLLALLGTITGGAYKLGAIEEKLSGIIDRNTETHHDALTLADANTVLKERIARLETLVQGNCKK